MKRAGFEFRALPLRANPASWSGTKYPDGVISEARVRASWAPSLGAYTVSEMCRILQPTMTPRKVHYWLDKGFLGEPLARGEPGHPTLLTFEQLLRVRTVQHLRDQLHVSLPRVAEAFEWILETLFAEEWLGLRFARAAGSRHIPVRRVAVRSGDDRVVVDLGQAVLPDILPELEDHLRYTRSAWEESRYVIPGFPRIESNPQVLTGAPVVSGTRIETSLIRGFALAEEEAIPNGEVIRLVRRTYPGLSANAVKDALRFEGLAVAA